MVPPVGSFWSCHACGAMFDVFDPAAGATAPASESVAVLFFTFGSRVPAERAAFSRTIATTVSALVTIPAAGTIWLLVRYRQKRREFAAAWQRFHEDRDEGAGA